MRLFLRFFLILLLFSLLPVSGMGIWMLTSRQAVRDNARLFHGRLAALTADLGERFVEQMNRTLTIVEDLERARGQALAEGVALRRAAASDAAIAWASVLDASGAPLERVADPSIYNESNAPNPAADPAFVKSRGAGRAAIGEPFFLAEQGLISIVHPISSGRFFYMVYSLRGLQRNLARISQSGAGRLLFVDAAGRPVRGVGDAAPFPDWTLPPDPGEAGWRDLIATPQGPWVAASVSVPSLNWRAVSLQHRAEAYSESDDAATRALFFFLGVCVLVAGGAYALSDRLMKPVISLIGGAERISRGEFGHPIPALGWGELDHLGKTFNGMAEKVRHYQELQVDKIMEEKAKIDTLVHNIPGGVLLLGVDGAIHYLNAGGARVLGVAKGAAVTNVSQLVKAPWLKELFEPIKKGIKQPQAKIVEIAGSDPEHPQVYACEARVVARDKKGVGILVLMRDITVERDLEHMKEDFFHAVVHDLRGPITIIDAIVHFMTANPNLSEKQRQHVDMADQASKRLSSLVGNILDIAKFESGTMTIVPARIKAQTMMNAVNVLYRAPAEAKGVRLELEPCGELEFTADQGLLERVVMNLVGNALKFTPSGGSIFLKAVSLGQDVEISVRDTGPGIPADKLAAVFEKFKQLDRDAAKRAGYGLGLSICRRIVELHGGTIWVESQEGQGSRFAFRIPVNPRV